MGRHTIFKGIQIEVERIRVHATTEHLLAIVGFFMDTLSAGGYLEASHEEVKAECQTRVLGVVHGVESTVLGGEMRYKDEIGSVFVICIFADSAFLFRSQVVFTAVISLTQVILKEDLMYFA